MPPLSPVKVENKPGGDVEDDAHDGKWEDSEHVKFLEGLKAHGKRWSEIRNHVGSRTCQQVRSHAQKFFKRMEKLGLYKRTNSRVRKLESSQNDDTTHNMSN